MVFFCYEIKEKLKKKQAKFSEKIQKYHQLFDMHYQQRMYEIPRYQVLPGAQYWEQVTPEYELIMECDGNELIIILDSSTRNFKRRFSNFEQESELKQFQSANRLFFLIKDVSLRTIDYKDGIISIQKQIAKNEIISINLEKVDSTLCQLQFVVRKFARIFHIQRNQNVKVRQQIDKHKLSSKRMEYEVSEIKREEKQKKKFRQMQRESAMKIIPFTNQVPFSDSESQINKSIDELQRQNRLRMKDIKQIKEQMKSISKKIQLIKEQISNQKYEQSSSIQKLKLGKIDEINPSKQISPITLTTICPNNFSMKANTVTLQKETGNWQAVLFNTGRRDPFNFHVFIEKTKESDICVGVADWSCQKGTEQIDLSHGIRYDGSGVIEFGTGNGQYQKKYTQDALLSQFEVWLKIQPKSGLATFTLRGKPIKINQPWIRKYSVQCPIFSETNRQFFPFLEFYDQGDSITWLQS